MFATRNEGYEFEAEMLSRPRAGQHNADSGQATGQLSPTDDEGTFLVSFEAERTP
jgi:hypothetical protein